MSGSVAPLADAATTDPEPARPASGRRSALLWMTAGCLLLCGSGVARSLQDRRHRVESSYTESCPFPLRSIPATLGGWKLLDGKDRSLDPLTMRITGGTDHLLRTYVDELTGVSLVVLVLFGPAEPVMPHTPEVCYPSCGFTAAGDMGDRVIKSEGGLTSRFRSATYAKSGGRATFREEVYYSFRLEGQWAPDSGAGRKFPRRNPSVFKVQVQRRVADGERRDQDDPIEQFLAQLVPAIEERIASAAKPAATSAGGPAPSAIRGAGGGPERALVGEAQADRRSTGRAMRPAADDPGQPVGEHRAGTDQADDREDRHQVDGKGDLDRDADRVASPDRCPLADPVAKRPAFARVLRSRNHRGDSFC